MVSEGAAGAKVALAGGTLNRGSDAPTFELGPSLVLGERMISADGSLGPDGRTISCDVRDLPQSPVSPQDDDVACRRLKAINLFQSHLTTRKPTILARL